RAFCQAFWPVRMWPPVRDAVLVWRTRRVPLPAVCPVVLSDATPDADRAAPAPGGHAAAAPRRPQRHPAIPACGRSAAAAARHVASPLRPRGRAAWIGGARVERCGSRAIATRGHVRAVPAPSHPRRRHVFRGGAPTRALGGRRNYDTGPATPAAQ